jgi:hypothetical protein
LYLCPYMNFQKLPSKSYLGTYYVVTRLTPIPIGYILS